MKIRVLGPFEMVADDGQLVDVGGHLPRALLVALALAEGHPVTADQLLEQVWAHDVPGERNRLQVHISRFRKVLGSDRILTRAGGYSLDIPARALDAARFGQLAADGRAALQRQDAAEAARLLRQALGLWRGRPLTEFADTGFAAPVVTRLEEARLTATEDRIEAELKLGRHRELTGELEALVQEHPLRERLWGQVILALYRSGRQGDSLGAYRRARAVLADELGVDPGPELRKLEAAVLGQDPALDAPAVPSAESPERGSGNLPAAASELIGRTAELDAVASMLQASRGVRFRMLQTLAEYGRGRLAERGELAAVRARHTLWASSTTRPRSPGWRSSAACTRLWAGPASPGTGTPARRRPQRTSGISTCWCSPATRGA
jgi:DNA-binding SARP family transcriptional activator